MRRRDFLQVSVAIATVSSLATSCGDSGEVGDVTTLDVPQRFALRSSAFADGGMIPAVYTCQGGDRSPELHWDAPPSATQSLALLVDDPDAPRGSFTHWLLYNLPPDLRQLPAGITNQPQLEGGGVQGKNSFGRIGYGGPCPPSGTHRYVFRLYALDQRLDLPPGANLSQAIAAMTGHVLAVAILTGRFAKA
ncbi:MAG TPA: YbhB/YbcL family Raf kinase inhibitor-like protein [Chroococcidiopsis sp.]